MSSGCSLAVLIVFICAVVAVAMGAITQIVAASQVSSGKALSSLSPFVAGYSWMYVAGLVLGIAAIVTSFSCQWHYCKNNECTCAGSEAAQEETETEA